MRKTRSDKKINVNPALHQDTHDKLYKLSVSCGMSKTKLAGLIIAIQVNNPDFVNEIQDRYNKDNFYRVTPISIDKKITY